jgi:hypothetical protein
MSRSLSLRYSSRTAREGKGRFSLIILNFGQCITIHHRETTLQRRCHICIPLLEIARSQSQFPHSSDCERFIYSQDRSTYFLKDYRQVDRGNIWIPHRHMNVEIGTVAVGIFIPLLRTFDSNFRFCFFAVYETNAKASRLRKSPKWSVLSCLCQLEGYVQVLFMCENGVTWITPLFDSIRLVNTSSVHRKHRAGICSRVKGWKIDSWNRLGNKLKSRCPCPCPRQNQFFIRNRFLESMH